MTDCSARPDRLSAAKSSGGDAINSFGKLTTLVYREAMGLDERFSQKVSELSSFARSRMAEEFRMVADKGLMVPCDVELVTTIVNGAMINIIMEYVLQKKDRDLEELADALVTNQLRALTALPGEPPRRKPAKKA